MHRILCPTPVPPGPPRKPTAFELKQLHDAECAAADARAGDAERATFAAGAGALGDAGGTLQSQREEETWFVVALAEEAGEDARPVISRVISM